MINNASPFIHIDNGRPAVVSIDKYVSVFFPFVSAGPFCVRFFATEYTNTIGPDEFLRERDFVNDRVSIRQIIVERFQYSTSLEIELFLYKRLM